MNQAEARAIIREALAAIAPEADLDTVPGNASLRDELDLDSMDFLNFITALHESTGIDMPEVDYPRLATLDDIVSYMIR
jgi:acyl carrier protein